MDSSVCPVRRSRRLNPELGPWLTFTDEPLGALPSMCLDTETHNLEEDLGSLTDSSQGRQLPQGSQIPALESPCESGCGDTDEDPSCPQPTSRGILWSTREGWVDILSPLGSKSTQSCVLSEVGSAYPLPFPYNLADLQENTWSSSRFSSCISKHCLMNREQEALSMPG
jgi:hypothetical protein